MSTYLELTISFHDGTDPIELRLTKNIQRDTFMWYAEEQLATMPFNKNETIRATTEFHKMAVTAAHLQPIKADFIDDEWVVSGKYGSDEYVAMFFPNERKHLFKHEDPAITEAYIKRYVELYNKGDAFFGAQLKNIDTITFQFS